MPQTARSERALVVVLRISAVLTIAALIGVVLPRSWMAAAHEYILRQPFPDGPIVQYLARSLSAFYAIHGGLAWICSGDVQRYRPVIVFFGWTGLLGGIGLLALDLWLGLPAPWIICEGPFVAALATVILVLVSRVDANRVAAPAA